MMSQESSDSCPHYENGVPKHGFANHKQSYNINLKKRCVYCENEIPVALEEGHLRNACEVYKQLTGCAPLEKFLTASMSKSHDKETKPKQSKFSELGKLKVRQCIYCKTSLNDNIILYHEKECAYRPMKCTDCCKQVPLKDYASHRCKSLTRTNQGNTSATKCSYCKGIIECDSSHEEKCLYKPIRCATCNDVVKLTDHEWQMASVKANEKLVKDLEGLLKSEDYSDVIINVKDEAFRLHKAILVSRNAYFASMFKAEMKETTTGVVSIEDCNPDTFRSFIYFVYTGKIQTLSYDNVCGLYEIADKYQEDQLKAECLCFMKKNVSTASFCDFIVLALTYDEKELLEKSTEFFCGKTNEIIQGVKWQEFMREHPTEANELYIKALNQNTK